jgi:hypothetical protein
MTAVAASNAGARRAFMKPACKPRANYLKPKEIRDCAEKPPPRRFDLRQSLNYLKVKVTGRKPVA